MKSSFAAKQVTFSLGLVLAGLIVLGVVLWLGRSQLWKDNAREGGVPVQTGSF
jgi:hypothetical protein